jgi:hypothetical protein
MSRPKRATSNNLYATKITNIERAQIYMVSLRISLCLPRGKVHVTQRLSNHKSTTHYTTPARSTSARGATTQTPGPLDPNSI